MIIFEGARPSDTGRSLGAVQRTKPSVPLEQASYLPFLASGLSDRAVIQPAEGLKQLLVTSSLRYVAKGHHCEVCLATPLALFSVGKGRGQLPSEPSTEHFPRQKNSNTKQLIRARSTAI